MTEKEASVIIRRLRAFAKTLGFKVHIYQLGLPFHTYQYDPAVQSFRVARSRGPQGAEHTISMLAHEIGHWLVATPEQRAQPDYGLGAGYYSTVGVPPLVTGESEYRASCAGILVEQACGAELTYTYHYHGWDKVPELFTATCEQLVRAPNIPTRGVVSYVLEGLNVRDGIQNDHART